MSFTAQATLQDLMAEIPDRTTGVFMDEADDEYGTMFSVHVAVHNDDDTWTWHDISGVTRSVDWDRGATDPLEQPEVGTATVTVDNNNGHFSPWNTTVGPFAGTDQSLLLPGSPFRFGVTRWDPADHSTITWLPFFSGRIESIEETLNDPSGADAQVVFNLVDVAASLAAHGDGVKMGGGPGALHAWQLGAAITLPLTVTTGTNDTFKLGSDAYVVAAGTYTTLADVAAAMSAALFGAVPFSDFVTVAALDLGLLLTVVGTGTSTLTLHLGTNDVLTDLGFGDGSGFSTYEDIYYGETGAVMLPGLLADVGYGFGYIDGVTSVDPDDPFFTVAELQSPERSSNRLQAAQDIATACNCMVFASSSGQIIVVRFGPAVDGSPDFGTFTNTGDPSDGYPLTDATIYASTDRILNTVTGQAVQITTPQLEVLDRDQHVGATNGNTHLDVVNGDAHVTTTNGDVHIEATTTGSVNIASPSGDLNVDLDAGDVNHNLSDGAFNVATVDGGVEMSSTNTDSTYSALGGASLNIETVGGGHVKIQGESVDPSSGNTDGNFLKRVSGVWIGAPVSVSIGAISLTSADIIVGNGSNVGAAVAISGDATLANTGALTVTGLRGHAVKNAAPSDAQALLWNNSNSDWEPVSISGDATVTNAGALTVGAGAITGSKIASSVALAGSPTTTTQSPGDNSTKIATTAYVDAAVSGGGGVSPGTVLATVLYAPSPIAVYAQNVSPGTIVAPDTTNLTLPFTVPASGIVDVEVSCYTQVSETTTTNTLWFALLDHSGGAIVGTPVLAVATNVAQVFVGALVRVVFHLTGLTPGALRLDFAAGSVNASGCSATVYAGNGGGSTSVATDNATVGPFFMQARASA